MIHGGNVWKTGNPSDWLDFSANLRPEGPPDWVTETLRSTLDDIRFYPAPEMKRARRGLAGYLGIPEECVLPTAGGTAAIDLALTYRTGCVYIPEPAFGEYARRAEAHGRAHAPWDGNCGRGETLILSNPDNPTGSIRCKETLLALHRALNSAEAELVVDEAFIDYCPENSLRGAIAPGLMIVGSMTKVLGIPGARLGYLCAVPEVIRSVRDKMLPWSLGTQAAEIAAHLPEHAESIRRDAETNRRRREQFAAQLEQLGVKVMPSQSNFLLADFRRDMTEPVERLKEQGILVRTCTSFGLENSFLRLAVRTEKENGRLIAALEEILHAR